MRRAVDRLGELTGTDVVGVSTLRNTDPVGFLDQPQFLNGVVELETALPPRTLLETLLDLEHAFGRDRSAFPPQGPRTLDLDLLVYGDQVISEPGLEVPHPRLRARRFVLEPLAELAPTLEVPGMGRVETLLAELDS